MIKFSCINTIHDKIVRIISYLYSMLGGNPIVALGFHIPSDNPVFLTAIAIHITASLTCVVAGLFAIFAKKQAGLHPKAGRVYYWSWWVVFITIAGISAVRWQEDCHLFIIGILGLCAVFTGRRAERKKWQKWSIIHITCMGFSYILLLTGFYIDNGRFLPVWKYFNPILYWVLPSAIGIPIIMRTLLRHPLSREYFTKK